MRDQSNYNKSSYPSSRSTSQSKVRFRQYLSHPSYSSSSCNSNLPKHLTAIPRAGLINCSSMLEIGSNQTVHGAPATPRFKWHCTARSPQALAQRFSRHIYRAQGVKCCQHHHASSSLGTDSSTPHTGHRRHLSPLLAAAAATFVLNMSGPAYADIQVMLCFSCPV